MKSYVYQVINLDTDTDRDLIEFLAGLKKKRLASAYIKEAIREKMVAIQHNNGEEMIGDEG
ncbi:MAG: hypothetical protein JRE40_04970 [Deltaproteobacteria bacterium]|nr:hypothetical protein [Deltaproteobacteria bacterium]